MANYEWSFGSNDAANLSFEMNPYHIYNDAGLYSVGLTVVTTDGCTTGFYIENMIEVYPLPVANFISDPQSVTIVKPFVYFTNLSTGADICFWSFGDGDSSTVFNPYHTYSIYPTGTYNVNLVAFTNHGCTDTASAEIVVQNEYTFYAPSAFSPDNDAINDVFYVFGNGIDKRNFKMFIFDRWGEVIYNSTDITEGWDGRVKGGEMGKNGVYTWLVIYKDQQGIERQESGAVSIIR
jgi:gliding motility-associated-like protein